jgi:hypothetical protein
VAGKNTLDLLEVSRVVGLDQHSGSGFHRPDRRLDEGLLNEAALVVPLFGPLVRNGKRTMWMSVIIA